MGRREVSWGCALSGINNSIDALEKRTRERCQLFLDRCAAAGHRLCLFETLRSVEVQAAYCAQGREDLVIVNDRRFKVSLRPISTVENKYKITDEPPAGLLVVNAHGRGHGNGTAFDVVPVTAGGKLLWSSPADVWFAIGEIGELCGLIWGGRWKPKDTRTGLGFDPNHFQLPQDEYL
jgi:hypothetical protein